MMNPATTAVISGKEWILLLNIIFVFCSIFISKLQL